LFDQYFLNMVVVGISIWCYDVLYYTITVEFYITFLIVPDLFSANKNHRLRVLYYIMLFLQLANLVHIMLSEFYGFKRCHIFNFLRFLLPYKNVFYKYHRLVFQNIRLKGSRPWIGTIIHTYKIQYDLMPII